MNEPDTIVMDQHRILAARRGRRSREKGKAGELECARAWEKAFPGRVVRASLLQAGGGSATVTDLVVADTYAIEVKRGNTPHFFTAFEQAKAGAGIRRIPMVNSRRDNEQWMVYMPLGDMLNILIELEELRKLQAEKEGEK